MNALKLQNMDVSQVNNGKQMNYFEVSFKHKDLELNKLSIGCLTKGLIQNWHT